MKHIAFVFTSGEAWTSKLIRLQTWGEVNHGAFEFVEDNALIQIQSPKCILIHPDALFRKSKTVFRFVLEIPDEIYEEVFQWAKDNIIGKAYDKVSVARFLIPLRGILGRLKPAVRSASETWFCQEGTECLGRKCGKGLVRSTRDLARVSPQDAFDSIRLESTEVVLYQEYVGGELVYSGPYRANS